MWIILPEKEWTTVYQYTFERINGIYQEIKSNMVITNIAEILKTKNNSLFFSLLPSELCLELNHFILKGKEDLASFINSYNKILTLHEAYTEKYKLQHYNYLGARIPLLYKYRMAQNLTCYFAPQNPLYDDITPIHFFWL